MSQLSKQIVVAIVFVILLALVGVYGNRTKLVELWHQGDSSSSTSDPATQSLNRYGFRLTEGAHEAAIDFRHQSPTLDKGLAHIMPVVAAMGASVAICDFDAD